MSAILDARGLRVSYAVGSRLVARLRRRPAPIVHAIDGIDLVVERGSAVGIVGESGCGKSTLAKALVGLAPLSAGTVAFAGEPLGNRRTRAQTRHIQIVFQDPSASLNPSMTIGQTLRELLRVHDMVPAGSVQRRAEELLELVELPASLLNAYPRRLSGGQRQRVGIARALALEPEILVADESVAALDVSVQAAILNLLQKLRTELGLTLLFISHDLAVVRHISDRVVVMYLGTIVEDRPTEDLFRDPRHPYTAALLEAAPQMGVMKQPGGSVLRGEPGSLHNLASGCRFHPRCPIAQDICREEEPLLRGPSESAHDCQTETDRAACHFAWTELSDRAKRNERGNSPQAPESEAQTSRGPENLQPKNRMVSQ
ncbi:peptide/nickel transport system ATP-binding protein/oligopeptide transport system ATP-binding protein [Microterricola gilva]|uniref:Peptide/nickel transport system ATP-binding protein/oligopeptide transport system ATP-binding protein n=1 Tax=Microterricola gilva TaxID=393267 RepID=A0A4Q8AN40_9MICO|nr:ABC transporter ATP-binding protein [Microterricola gilva]RZU65359.1 peptide/nickel transport system ATP-binding protein/oligopeptide transport system ATP-binding protein [Microterricola gilva]